jgi:hypothetical protein
VARIERMDLAIAKEVVEVLVVRLRHEVIVTAGDDLGRGRDGVLWSTLEMRSCE